MEYVVIFGREIPVYGLLGVVGVLFGICLLFLICKAEQESFDDAIFVFLWAGIFAMLGAKILYLTVELDSIIEDITSHKYSFLYLLSKYTAGGFVFYGGLLGALLGAVLACNFFGFSIRKELNLCIPTLPMIHGFGRIGCSIVGCCYGMNYEGPMHITYVASHYAPNNTPLFPTQLVEAILNFGIVALLLLLSQRKEWRKKRTIIYLFLYSICRFILEFFRGDEYRGIIVGLSTSQWISMLIIISSAIYLYWISRRGVNESTL
ncbi:MAG: prolipoprotein diacylglyceryl transferase [Butyrivibrio sp.]|nr:prolipoprotein diacylglyceryl transferase [Butyrivibrio sp.]